MKEPIALILALTFGLPPSSPQAQSHSRNNVVLVHFVAINMSGAARELRHGSDVVDLPVAERVSLQVPAGDKIEIFSPTDTTVNEIVAIAATDQGCTMPIH